MISPSQLPRQRHISWADGGQQHAHSDPVETRWLLVFRAAAVNVSAGLSGADWIISGHVIADIWARGHFLTICSFTRTFVFHLEPQNPPVLPKIFESAGSAEVDKHSNILKAETLKWK